MSREVRGKKLFTKRLITKKYHVPKWGRNGPKWYVTNIIEESVVDPVKKTITTYTRNIDLTWFVVSFAVVKDIGMVHAICIFF